MNRHVRLAVIFLCLTLAIPLVQSEVFTQQQRSEVDNIVNSLLGCYGFKGLSMAVVHGNETFVKAYGKAGVSSSAHNLTRYNKFGIASITKTFTSALISILLENTSYSWDSTVKDIMGNDFAFATQNLTRELTLVDVLSHQTGLLSHNILFATRTPFPRNEYVRKIRFLPKFQEPGKYQYNNYVYALAGYIAEKLAGDGRSWEQLLRDYILDPLGMNNTGALGLDLSVQDDMLVMGTLRRNGTLVEMNPEVYRTEPVHAAASLASTPGDMAKWMKMIIKRGRTEQGQQLLSQASLIEMIRVYATKVYNVVRNPPYIMEGYGLGWKNDTYRGEQIIEHDGDICGHCSLLWIIPSQNIGIFAVHSGPCVQKEYWVNFQIFTHVADTLMGHEPWRNSGNACKVWKVDPPKSLMDCNSLFKARSRYTGAYCHPFFGEFNIVQEERQGLHIYYDDLQADLCSNIEANIIKFQVRESLASYYYEAVGFPRNVLQLNFSSFVDGRYGMVELNDSVLGKGPISFERCG